MGLIKNLVNAKVSGNVGSMNFRKRGAQTVVAERSYTNSSKGNGASLLQRQHRSRLANIVNFFRAIAAIEARAWQNKPGNNSDFNMFGKYNLAASPIFLTKQEAVANAAVIAPYEVSRGALATLAQAFVDSKFVCGVVLGAGLDLTQNTLGTISQAIIDNNPEWKNGDKLSVALLSHAYTEVAGVSVPKVNVVYVEITLDVASDINFMQVPSVAAAAPSVDTLGRLCFDLTCNAAFAVHSRKVSGVLETSSQMIIMANAADPIYLKYSSEAQKDAAMLSYGYQSDVLLTPDNVEAMQPADVKIASVSAITFKGANLAKGSTIEGPGSLVIKGTDLATSNVKVMVSGVGYVPQSATPTEFTYSLGKAGNLVILINGVAYTNATLEVTITTSFTSLNFGGENITPLPNSGRTIDGDNEYSCTLNGVALGTITATGGTIVSQSGDEEQRTFVFRAPTDDPFTISSNGIVFMSGNAIPGGMPPAE